MAEIWPSHLDQVLKMTTTPIDRILQPIWRVPFLPPILNLQLGRVTWPMWLFLLWISALCSSKCPYSWWHSGLQKTFTLSGNFTNEPKIFCEICVRETHMMSTSRQVLIPMNGPRAFEVQVYIFLSLMQSELNFGAFVVICTTLK